MIMGGEDLVVAVGLASGKAVRVSSGFLAGWSNSCVCAGEGSEVGVREIWESELGTRVLISAGVAQAAMGAIVKKIHITW